MSTIPHINIELVPWVNGSSRLNEKNMNRLNTDLAKLASKMNEVIDALNGGDVKSVQVTAGAGLSSSDPTVQHGLVFTQISVAEGYKLPTEEEWENRHGLVPITWAELKALRDGGELVPGQQYRITDYTCTTTQANTQSAGHAFDIIVTADSPSILNERARATQHDGDSYFGGRHLNAWGLMYSIDNDLTRFMWADTVNGKGVVYWMKDEYGNECPYDFKNIQYFDPATYLTITYTIYGGDRYDRSAKDDVEINGTQYYGWRRTHYADYYVFLTTDLTPTTSSAVYDSSGAATGYAITEVGGHRWEGFAYTFNYSNGDATMYASFRVMGNTIKERRIRDTGYFPYPLELNRIVLIASSTPYWENNYFDVDCHDFLVSAACTDNRFGARCHDIKFGSYCSYNVFESDIGECEWGSFCTKNFLGRNSYSISFKDYNYNVYLNGGCSYIRFGCYVNHIEMSGCHDIYIMPNETARTYIGNGSNVSITFGWGCAYLNIIPNPLQGSFDSTLRNFTIGGGVHGSSSTNLRNITINRGLTARETYVSSGEVKIILD